MSKRSVLLPFYTFTGLQDEWERKLNWEHEYWKFEEKEKIELDLNFRWNSLKKLNKSLKQRWNGEEIREKENNGAKMGRKEKFHLKMYPTLH